MGAREVRMFRKTNRDLGKIIIRASVIAISANSFEARGLKYGMKFH